MIGGFALVAYPAEYDNSGVMTFIVNQDGTVYEKDLGPNTNGIASGMTAFNPDSSWRKVVNNGLPQPKREAPAKPTEKAAPAKAERGRGPGQALTSPAPFTISSRLPLAKRARAAT